MDSDGDHCAGGASVDPDLFDAASGTATGPAAGLQAIALLAVAAGGAIGAPARYALEEVFPAPAGGFPAATFAINVAGAFALGLFLVVLGRRAPSSRHLRPFVAAGFLGAFTTFSTFAVELVVLGKDGHLPMAVLYAAASIAVGLAAAWCGTGLGRRVPATREAAR